ncbi:hypothetical protein [Dactylosporangium sp. NPDC000521]|uniref:hypothetical protein n=1 Tax=Dactylosporangium sp. NPDC000521 TaxID=3363975 RepID=UPI0036A40A2F
MTHPIAAALALDGLSLPADFVAPITRANLHRFLDREGLHACRTDVTGPPDGTPVVPRRDDVYWCAPTVELFAYRFLVEARLVTAIDEQRRAGDLDPEQLAYLTHYVRR